MIEAVLVTVAYLALATVICMQLARGIERKR